MGSQTEVQDFLVTMKLAVMTKVSKHVLTKGFVCFGECQHWIVVSDLLFYRY